MVDSRFRRRTLQRVILGIRTPAPDPHSRTVLPRWREVLGDANPRHLRSGSLPARQLRVVPMVPGSRVGSPPKATACRAAQSRPSEPDPPRQPGDHGMPGARVPMESHLDRITQPGNGQRGPSPPHGAQERHMRGTDSSVSKDPIETLTRRARRAWRQSERQIVAEHRNDVASRLRQLATLQPPLQATSKPEAAPSAIVSLTFPDWQILIADVALKTTIALAAAAKAHRLRLSDAGRYREILVALHQQQPRHQERPPGIPLTTQRHGQQVPTPTTPHHHNANLREGASDPKGMQV